MFDRQAVDEYRRLTAPASLKDRVMTATAAKKPAPIRFIPVMSTIAACLALLVISATLWLTPLADVTVSTDGMLITNKPQVMTANASPRMTAEHTAIITLEADGDFTVESDDTFYITDPNGEFVSLPSPYRAEGTLTLHWSVTAPDAQLTVNGARYELHADTENGTVSITESVQD